MHRKLTQHVLFYYELKICKGYFEELLKIFWPPLLFLVRNCINTFEKHDQNSEKKNWILKITTGILKITTRILQITTRSNDNYFRSSWEFQSKKQTALSIYKKFSFTSGLSSFYFLCVLDVLGPSSATTGCSNKKILKV